MLAANRHAGRSVTSRVTTAASPPATGKKSTSARRSCTSSGPPAAPGSNRRRSVVLPSNWSRKAPVRMMPWLPNQGMKNAATNASPPMRATTRAIGTRTDGHAVHPAPATSHRAHGGYVHRPSVRPASAATRPLGGAICPDAAVPTRHDANAAPPRRPGAVGARSSGCFARLVIVALSCAATGRPRICDQGDSEFPGCSVRGGCLCAFRCEARYGDLPRRCC